MPSHKRGSPAREMSAIEFDSRETRRLALKWNAQ